MTGDDQRSAPDVGPDPGAASFNAGAYALAYRHASRLGMAHLSAVQYARRHAYGEPDRRHVAGGGPLDA
ncbi:MAG: hypothetical protein V3S31_01505 [Dehalococcoidia bacterium]